MAYTKQFEEVHTTSDTDTLGNVGWKVVASSKFVYTGESIDITRIVGYLSKVGSPTQTVTASIYTHDSGNDTPDAVIDTSDSVNASTLGDAEAAHNFDGASASLTNGVTYWVVFRASADDASNYIRYHRTGTGTTERICDGSGSAGSETWSVATTYSSMRFELWSGSDAGTSVTPEAALISGTGDQPSPEVMGDANLAPNALDQETELLDPDIDTTRNLGVGNYRSTKVTMNW